MIAYAYRLLSCAELKQPAHFMTESDCEIIIHLYEEQGPNFVNLLNGIFAFALYDARSVFSSYDISS